MSNDLNAHIQTFERQGYLICPADDLSALDAVQQAISDVACEQLGLPVASDKTERLRLLNDFHGRNLEGTALNDVRMAIFRGFNQRVDAGRLLFQAFGETLTRMLGSDIAMQKSTNLVIQQPHDPNQSPVHRDAPPNSLYEVVLWVPMVDCFGTKGMKVLDLQQTDRALAMLEGPEADFDAFAAHAMAIGTDAVVPYGHGLIFWTRCVHAIPVNVETETRWSVNVRYKNVFTPYGAKGFPDFFKILHLSPVTRAAMAMERRSQIQEPQ